MNVVEFFGFNRDLGHVFLNGGKQLKEKNEDKKVWESPNLVVYGDMNSLTQQIKPKQPGSMDDFMVAGISNP